MAGRLSDYDETIDEKALDYLNNFESYGNKVPSIVGLSRAINVSRTTIYDWHQQGLGQFYDIVDQIKERQEEILIDRGLGNEFNSSITKLMLTKHGYADKQETTVDIGEDTLGVIASEPTTKEWLDEK